MRKTQLNPVGGAVPSESFGGKHRFSTADDSDAGGLSGGIRPRAPQTENRARYGNLAGWGIQVNQWTNAGKGSESRFEDDPLQIITSINLMIYIRGFL